MKRTRKEALAKPIVGDAWKDKHGQTLVIMPLGPGMSRDWRSFRRLLRSAEYLGNRYPAQPEGGAR